MLAKYSNSDIFLSLAAIYLTGGSCIEDSNRLSRNFTEISQGYRFCSADTILRMIKAAKSDNEGFVSKAGAKYQFSINQGLCGMLLDGMLKTGQVTEGEEHVFDYDNQFIPAEKYDAKYSYKGLSDIFPASRRSTGSRSTSKAVTGTRTSSSSRARPSGALSSWPPEEGLLPEGKDGLRIVLGRGCPGCRRELQGILHQGHVVRQPA